MPHGRPEHPHARAMACFSRVRTDSSAVGHRRSQNTPTCAALTFSCSSLSRLKIVKKTSSGSRRAMMNKVVLHLCWSVTHLPVGQVPRISVPRGLQTGLLKKSFCTGGVVSATWQEDCRIRKNTTGSTCHPSPRDNYGRDPTAQKNNALDMRFSKHNSQLAEK